MKNFTLLFALLFLFLSCGKKDDSASSSLPAPNGHELLPELPQIGEDNYSPRGLSDKMIISNGKTHAPMDLLTQDLTMAFDPSKQKASGKSVIQFRVKKSGRPYFELQASVKNLKLDHDPVGATSITDPDGQKQGYWSLDQELAPGEVHELELEYDFPVGRVSFTNGGVGFLTDMTDLQGKFFEYWGPVGFEEDAFALKLKLKLLNSTSEHQLFTNGEVTSDKKNDWEISFPDYFSKSSFYVHLTNNSDLTVKNLTYRGLERDVPVQVYGADAALVNSAVTELPKLFKELEGDYGPYSHARFLAYMNKTSGGMEYVRATITSLGSLDHELLHSWFARSIIPADGRSGWIDEAIASWRDYGYARATSVLKRTPTNLANYSPFRKSTPSNCYVDGRALMAELDLEFKGFGGMKPILKALFQRYKYKVITNEEFWGFLGDQTHMDLEPFNLRYAMSETEDRSTEPYKGKSRHPTPLTEEEVLRLR